ncbi:50S ribosomal protein L15 [Patescibacteria group bacterium]|nr:50S ribosomal protein L15 [Patescibacteria group bacterium]
MQLNNLKRKNPNKTTVKIGRGGKRGKTSGRGHKGQNARAGTSKRPDVRDLIKRLPKKRGYQFKSFQERPVLVNLAALELNFTNGEDVTPKILVEKLVVKKKENKVPSVKILGNGDLTIKLNVSDCSFSQSAKEKIEKNGGKIK